MARIGGRRRLRPEEGQHHERAKQDQQAKLLRAGW
jgi:hypothetical protein